MLTDFQKRVAQKIGDFLENNGWSIFQLEDNSINPTLKCDQCLLMIDNIDLKTKFCSFCGFRLNPTKNMEEEYNYTLDLLYKSFEIGLDEFEKLDLSEIIDK